MKKVIYLLLMLVFVGMAFKPNEVFASTVIPDWFDSEFYAKTYPDVVNVLGNSPEALWGHYERHGREEGRLPNGVELTYRIVINRTNNTCEVYNGDQIIRSMICSTGKNGKTPVGTYTIYEHVDGGGMHPMKGGVYARYCMRFKQGGYMLHTICYKRSTDTEPMQSHVEALGTSASSGCVRLAVEDAEWMYSNIPDGTTITITD